MLRRLLLAAMAATTIAGCNKPKQPSAMPSGGEAAPQAPATYRVRFETSRGPFVVEATRSWSPLGADRFYQLVKSGYFDDNRFYRVVPSFVVQFGAHGDPAVAAAWEKLAIKDDSVAHSNTRGTIVFATAGPDTRTTQLFINLIDNTQLDGMGFSPLGQVVEGMAVVDSLYSGYGDGPPGGVGPLQSEIAAKGNAYLERDFPKLDFIRTARIEGAATGDVATPADRAKK